MKTIRRIIALVLILATLVIPMTACSSDYKYVKMTVEGYGDVIIKVDMKAAPLTAKNFIRLVKDDFYDGLSFHSAGINIGERRPQKRPYFRHFP